MLERQFAQFLAGVETFDEKGVLLARPGFAYIRRQSLLALQTLSALIEGSHRQA